MAGRADAREGNDEMRLGREQDIDCGVMHQGMKKYGTENDEGGPRR